MRLFRSKNGVLELVRDELLLVREFSNVISFVKGKNLFSNITPEMIFTYIYFYCDYTSPYSNKDDDERHIKAVYEAQLPNDWYPDDIVNAAIDKYLELRETTQIKTLKSFQKALDLTVEVVDATSNRLRIALKKLSNMDLESITEVDEIQKYTTNFNMIKQDLDYLLKVQPNIKNNIKVNYDLLQQAIKDDFEDKKAAGERKIGNRADPGSRNAVRQVMRPTEVPIREVPKQVVIDDEDEMIDFTKK